MEELERPPAPRPLRDSGHHDASLTQIRDKTEPPHCPLSFPLNFKPSHALNYRQFDS